jgi:hypothetical protein
LVDAISELTRYDFEKVYRMEAVEFFSYVSYAKYKADRERKRMEAINKKIIV